MSAHEDMETVLKAGITIGRDPEGLNRLAGFVKDFFGRARLQGDVPFAFDLALTEWVTNVRDYGYPQDASGVIQVQLCATEKQVEATVEDDARPFNPLEHPEVDVSVPMAEKPIGGLGIHMIRKFMDQLRYEQKPGGNKLVMSKKLPQPRQTNG